IDACVEGSQITIRSQSHVGPPRPRVDLRLTGETGVGFASRQPATGAQALAPHVVRRNDRQYAVDRQFAIELEIERRVQENELRAVLPERRDAGAETRGDFGMDDPIERGETGSPPEHLASQPPPIDRAVRTQDTRTE